MLRKGGDSNPRATIVTNGFRDRRIQPLCHLSKQYKIKLKWGFNKHLFLIYLQAQNHGEVQEWLNWLAWKASIPSRVSRVRIPFSPLYFAEAT